MWDGMWAGEGLLMAFGDGCPWPHGAYAAVKIWFYKTYTELEKEHAGVIGKTSKYVRLKGGQLSLDASI